MPQLISFFEGHRGAVLSLVGNLEDNFFYSSGSEGLIVRWQADVPNEGQVLIKLAGYVSALAYDNVKNFIYAAVNHKGIYVIDAKTGQVIHCVDLPAISFGTIHLAGNYVVLTTNQGEIILLEKGSYKIGKRIDTQLGDFSKIATGLDFLWYVDANGIRNINLRDINVKGVEIRLRDKINSVGLLHNNLVGLTDNSIKLWDLKKHKLKYELIDPGSPCYQFLSINEKTSSLYVLSSTNEFYNYRLTKKGIQLIEKTRFSHKGQINKLLWIENYKFVISASADKKIGVWQIN